MRGRAEGRGARGRGGWRGKGGWNMPPNTLRRRPYVVYVDTYACEIDDKVRIASIPILAYLDPPMGGKDKGVVVMPPRGRVAY